MQCMKDQVTSDLTRQVPGVWAALFKWNMEAIESCVCVSSYAQPVGYMVSPSLENKMVTSSELHVPIDVVPGTVSSENSLFHSPAQDEHTPTHHILHDPLKNAF